MVYLSLRQRGLLSSIAVGVQLIAPAMIQAADKCLVGAAAGTDVTAIAAARTAVEAACDCQSFDGSSAALAHGKYVKCTKDLITTKVAAGQLRKECATVVGKIYSTSTCGFKTTAAGDKVACVKKTNGKVACSIKPQGSCTSSGSTTQVACPESFFCLDAADSNGDLLIDGSDSGSCTTVLGPIVGTTVDIPTAATPPNTPGTAGVKLTNSSLKKQFGTKLNLNSARYINFRYSRLRGTPDAVLITVAGFGGGANNFRILAENLLPRMRTDHGLTAQLWAFDRRTNLLEDRAGVVLAEHLGDPSVALDWYYGADLGLTLDPALQAKLKRRALFYNSSDDVPFIANWTGLVFSRDIDAVVEAARHTARNNNVFLGGHSAGTGFAARYAATDFNLTGAGAQQPGYAKLRGVALFEGTGGSTSGTSLTSDSLDRIIAKFDGGLFGAVRDNGPRCVDGKSACTIATEGTDCAGQVPPKCTLPTPAFAAIAGLSPLIFAAAEPSAIQGEDDPDSGQIILQVDQGAAGNNAVAKVPELSLLKALPASTVDGLFGNFLDDDGLGAQLSQAIAASIGAAGPVVNGLATWSDITQGPFPPSAIPNNGPAPTTLPGTDWGQEKEVTSIARLRLTFVGTSNASDWYYPASGLSVTSVSGACTAGVCTLGNVGAACSGATQAQADAVCTQSVSLDSTALSVGRGRRDIENLTQAPNINIPVICFGGSNGLAPVPGRFVSFANSIGQCTAPSCTGGTPRVVNASSPNPAFPTFGNAAGGFEVYISEGFAHLDVITAEDNTDNNVLAPLAAFLARNAVL